MIKLGPLKWIPPLSFQSKGIIELYDAAREISIALDGAVEDFFFFFWVCVLLLHTALLFTCKWAASNSMTREAINNGHIGGDPWCKTKMRILRGQKKKKAVDAAPSGVLRRQKKRESVMSNLHMHSNTNDESFAPVGSVPRENIVLRLDLCRGLWPSHMDFTKPGKCFACRHSRLDLSLASEAQWLQLLADHRHEPDNN